MPAALGLAVVLSLLLSSAAQAQSLGLSVPGAAGFSDFRGVRLGLTSTIPPAGGQFDFSSAAQSGLLIFL